MAANSNSEQLALVPLCVPGPPRSLVTESPNPGPTDIGNWSTSSGDLPLQLLSLASSICTLDSPSYSPAVPTPVKC